MRVLQPGDSMSRQALNGGRVDFSGPAIIGLSALFSDLVHEGNGGGSDKLSGSGSGSGGESPAAGGGAALVAPVWEQRALALTTCYLWRIDCASLYGSLRAEHPRLLLHLLTRTLGVSWCLLAARSTRMHARRWPCRAALPAPLPCRSLLYFSPVLPSRLSKGDGRAH